MEVTVSVTVVVSVMVINPDGVTGITVNTPGAFDVFVLVVVGAVTVTVGPGTLIVILVVAVDFKVMVLSVVASMICVDVEVVVGVRVTVGPGMVTVTLLVAAALRVTVSVLGVDVVGCFVAVVLEVVSMVVVEVDVEVLVVDVVGVGQMVCVVYADLPPPGTHTMTDAVKVCIFSVVLSVLVFSALVVVAGLALLDPLVLVLVLVLELGSERRPTVPTDKLAVLAVGESLGLILSRGVVSVLWECVDVEWWDEEELVLELVDSAVFVLLLFFEV